MTSVHDTAAVPPAPATETTTTTTTQEEPPLNEENRGINTNASESHESNGETAPNADESAVGDDDHYHDNNGHDAHDDDEYDPAHPSHEDDEYDPAHPDAGHAHAAYDPAPPRARMEVDAAASAQDATTASVTDVPPTSPCIKREPRSESTTTPPAPAGRSPKRQRRDEQRGLRDAAWDQLMDLESQGAFRVAQVSRAALASVAALPEFAQCTIIARFMRTPMQDVKDKNAVVRRLYDEYVGENPHVRSLQPVASFGLDAVADVGLFEFGYAPPMPASGMATVAIPYRQDKPGTITTPGGAVPTQDGATVSAVARGRGGSNSTRTTGRNRSTTTTSPAVDEFGRVLGNRPPSEAPSPGPGPVPVPVPVPGPVPGPSPVPASTPTRPSDPRRTATTPATGSASPTAAPGMAASTPAVAVVATAALPPSVSSTAKLSDPRRRGPGPTATEATTQHPLQQSDVYTRLPASVRGRLDAMVRAGRLPQSINDNVLSRLNHLPEAAALSAITKFGEADLRHVGNVNGFLVGIINRVQAPGATANHHPSPPAIHQPPPHSAAHLPPPYSGAPGHIASAPPSLMHDTTGNSFRDPRVAPSGFDSRPPVPQTMLSHGAPLPQTAWAVGFAGQQVARHGRFSSSPTIDQAITGLPVSVQNHLVSLVNTGLLPSVDELSEKCYEVLAQQSEALANEVLKRFGTANLPSVRNRSGFLIGVVKKCRQEYGFD